jgi:RNA polymerase sigma factor (sigma-70 family)
VTHQGVQAVRSEPTFEAFYGAQVEWARRLTFVLAGGDSRFVDDLVHEAFIRLQPRFDEIESPKAYLRVTLVNALKRHRHREARRDFAQEESARATRSTDPAIEELLYRIDRLPYRQRAVLVLRYFEDLSESEIAEVLECRPGTVKSLAARALARLREES